MKNKLTKEFEYRGSVDVFIADQIQGWCIKIEKNQKKSCQVRITYPNTEFFVQPSIKRPDVLAAHGVEECGFNFIIPESLRRLCPRIFFEDSNFEVSDLFDLNASRKNQVIFENTSSVISGWVRSNASLFSKIDLSVNGISQRTTTASLRSEDYEAVEMKGAPAYSAFNLRLPLTNREEEVSKIDLYVDGTLAFSRTQRMPSVKALIISETDNFDDASRKFRCDNLAKLLQREKCDTQIVGPTEFFAKQWPDYDLMIFCRLGIPQEYVERMEEIKVRFGTKIIFEVDDLIFMPWHTHDLGSVRSGMDDKNNPKLISLFQRRINTITVADAAITTTRSIARNLESMGLPTLIIPNMVRAYHIKNRVRPIKHQTDILCMAGSPTHYKDLETIEPILYRLLSEKNSARLTLLGRFRENLKLLELPNVKHISRLPYDQMMRTIDAHDLCLVPLEQTHFNDAKSCLKYIECGARGIPVIAQKTMDYSDRVAEGVTGLLCGTSLDWEDALLSAVENSELVYELGKAAQEDVSENYVLDNHLSHIVAWINEVTS